MNDPLDWTLLSSEYLFRDAWLTARRDRCLTPGGVLVDPYYVLEYPDWVNAVAFTREGKILMVRQYRHALGKVVLEIPGGCMEPADANPEAAMRRELLEETGHVFKEVQFLGSVSANPSTSTNLTHMYLATGGEKVAELHLDPNEELELLEMSPQEVMDALGQRRILQSLHASCLFYAFWSLGLFSAAPLAQNPAA